MSSESAAHYAGGAPLRQVGAGVVRIDQLAVHEPQRGIEETFNFKRARATAQSSSSSFVIIGP